MGMNVGLAPQPEELAQAAGSGRHLRIWDTIAEDKLAAADRRIDKLDQESALLASQPLMSRARDELAARVRSRPFGRCVVFYVRAEDGIGVVRVLHGARDIDAVFGDHR